MRELKVAMVGGWSSVVGFGAVGVDPYAVASPEDAPGVWDSLPREEYAVVMVTEPVYEALRRSVPGFPGHEGLPIVLPVPAVTGSLGMAAADIRKIVVKALGSSAEEEARETGSVSDGKTA